MPQDVKLSPDGRMFYVADMRAERAVEDLGAGDFGSPASCPPARGVHGLYPRRDARYLYATNRGEGTVSVIASAREKVVATWQIPGGGSPDMGGVSADGRVLWLSGRYNAEVYAIDTRDGRLIARIPVGPARTACACGRSRAATGWATPASCASRRRARLRPPCSTDPVGRLPGTLNIRLRNDFSFSGPEGPRVFFKGVRVGD